MLKRTKEVLPMKNEEEKDREMPSSSSFSLAKGLVNAVGGLVALDYEFLKNHPACLQYIDLH